MKKKITGCLATTALAILVLGIVALLSGGHFLCIETVYQILLANVLIHGWIFVVQRFESPYFLIEITLELGGVLLLLLGLVALFSWYESVSVFTGLPLKELLPLMRIMDLKQFDTAAVFEITRKSIMRALDSGLAEKEILEIIKKFCAYELPENLLVSIEDWSNSYSSASLYKGYVLKVDEKSTVLVQNNPSISPKISKIIAPGAFLLNVASDEEAQNLIKESGLDFIGSIQTPKSELSGPAFPVFEINRTAGSALLGGGTAQLRSGAISESEGSDSYGVITTDEERKEHFDMLRGLLDKMAITPEQREGLLLRINRKIILTPQQLNADSVKLEQIEANGMDYQGKVHVAESAITQNMMLELEYDDKKMPDGLAIIVGTPVSVEKNPVDSVVHLVVEPEHEERAFSLGQARNVKRIRGSVLR